jgi:hypothetical protein
MRVEYADGSHHVMSQRDRRRDILRNDVERQDFLRTLAQPFRNRTMLRVSLSNGDTRHIQDWICTYSSLTPVAVETEVDPQPLGDREHELAVGHLGTDVLGHPARLLQRTFLVATGAETAHPAGEGDKKLLPTLGAAHPGEAVLEIAQRRSFASIRWMDYLKPEVSTVLHE